MSDDLEPSAEKPTTPDAPAAADEPKTESTPPAQPTEPVGVPMGPDQPPLPAIEPRNRDTRPFRPASGEDHITTIHLNPEVEARLGVATPAPEPATAAPATATSATSTPTTPATAPTSAPRPPAPPELATRLVGLAYLVPCALLLWFFVKNAMGQVGTESAMARAVVRAVAFLLPGYPALLALFAVATGKKPPAAWNVFGLPFEGWWFTTLATLAWREVRSFFSKPVAYIVLFVWMLVNGGWFFVIVQYYGDVSRGQDFQVPPSLHVTSSWVTFLVLVLCCPALSMRLLSDEQARGTLEALLTAPVTCAQVVLSKYIGVLTFYVSMILSTLVFMFLLKAYATEWDWGPIFGGYLGLFLVGGLFLAIGVFASSLTDNQIIAFLLAILPNLFFFPLMYLFNNLAPPDLKSVLEAVDVYAMTQELSRGVLQWKTVVFYAASTFSALFLAVRGVESHTWR